MYHGRPGQTQGSQKTGACNCIRGFVIKPRTLGERTPIPLENRSLQLHQGVCDKTIGSGRTYTNTFRKQELAIASGGL